MGTVAEVCDDGTNDGSYDGCEAGCAALGPYCGDTMVNGSEECDDGGNLDGDGCSAVCLDEIPPATGESCLDAIVVTGDGFTYTNVDISTLGANVNLEPGTNCVGVQNDGSLNTEAVFEVALLAGETLWVGDSGGADLVMSIIGSTCADAVTCLDSSDFPDEASYTALADETVYVVADAYYEDLSVRASDVDLLFTITAPVCGDGVINGSDVCDDGNAVDETECAYGTMTCTACNADCSAELSLTGEYCGDTIVNGPEECEGTDPNGATCWDGSAPSCDVATCLVNYSGCPPAPGETCGDAITVTASGVESGDFGNFGNNYSLSGCGGFSSGADVAYAVTLEDGETLDVELYSMEDTVVAIVTDCGDISGSCLNGADAELGNATEVATYTNNTGGQQQVYVLAADYSSTSSGTYDLTMTIVPPATPVCGDGVINGSDVCDDGNIIDETECAYGTMTCTACNADCSAELSLTGGYCGDTIVNGPEECEGTDPNGATCWDGSAPSCDAASCTVDYSVCPAAPGATCGTAYDLDTSGAGVYPGDTTGLVNDYNGGYNLSGTCPNSYASSGTGADEAYAITIAPGETLDVALTSALDMGVFLVQDCAAIDTVGCLDSDDLAGGGGTENATYTNNGGTDELVYIIVDGYSGNEGAYVLDVSLTVPTPVTVDWCRIQAPTSDTTTEEGQYLDIYGQVFVSGLTDQSGTADPHPLLIAEVGVGPDGSDIVADPSLFNWNPATPNAGFNGPGSDVNDEYFGSIIVPPSGASYDHAVRFSGDGGVTWTYCDLTDNNYDVGDAGNLTPVATTVTAMPSTLGDVVITEVMQNPATPINDSDGEWFELYNPTGADFNLEGCVVTELGGVGSQLTIGGPFIVPAGSYGTAAVRSSPGFTPGYVYNGTANLNLANGADEIEIYCGGTLIDGIAYDGGTQWPDPNGASMSLDPIAMDAVNNDDGVFWCNGSVVYESNGNLGTPNAANPDCP